MSAGNMANCQLTLIGMREGTFMGDDHVTLFRLLGDVIHQQAENR